MTATQHNALEGVTVLSVGHTLPGLYCGAMLRDLGARIIRVERPAVAQSDKYEGMEAVFPLHSLTAGTDELQLNLKSPDGLAAFQRIAALVDVVIEGFRPGVMTRLGIDHERLSAENPALIYCAITGYGQDGADCDKVGHDVNYLAESGVLALGYPPGLPGVTFADGMAGVSAALNIVAAIHARSTSGRGQMLDCAIVDGPLSLMTSEIEHYWQSGQARGSGAHHLIGGQPWYGVYATRDNKQVALGAVEPQFYRNLCIGLGLTELLDKQFAPGQERAAAHAVFTAAIAAHSQSELIDMCRDAPACISPVLDTGEVVQSPLMARVLREGTDSEPLVRTPVRLPPADMRRGCDSQDVLASLGFSPADIHRLIGEIS